MSYKTSNKISNVFCYHVNVGHGNTSFLVLQDLKNEVKIFGIDCSIADDRLRCEKNIDYCISEIKKDFKLVKFELDMFLLTHPHNDHYSGMMHLITNNHIVQGTEIWLNNSFSMPSAFFINIKKALVKIGCKFMQPIANTTKTLKGSILDIWYPEEIVIKKGTMRQVFTTTKIPLREEANPNNASIITSFEFNIDGQIFSYLFTGDIEREGWDKVKCPMYLGNVQYYCISHHGSLNGHERGYCHRGQTISNISHCPNNIHKAILMGRHGAYKGIYSKQVCKDFKGKIIRTEGLCRRFVKLELTTGNVQYY